MTLWKHHTLNKRRVENLPKSLLASANPRVRLSSRVIRNAYHTAYSRSTAPVASYQFTTSAGIIRRLQKDSCPRLHTHTHTFRSSECQFLGARPSRRPCASPFGQTRTVGSQHRRPTTTQRCCSGGLVKFIRPKCQY